ncbi:MAG: ABC transporter ATP-binding protein [Pseudomonadota bacterium]
MIVFNNVTKFFPTKHGRKYIIRDASLTLQTGENVGVIGPNGAGKTTLMRLICGVDIPNAGRIETTYFLSWPMGIAGGLQGTMSGRENARFVCRILGESEKTINEKLKFIQDFAEIGRDFDLPVKNYSSGMKSRLQFAISMGFKFDCYIVDELTAVGDQSFREKSARVFKEKREEACFIKVSHNMEELKAECDSAIFLNQGKLYYFPDVVEGIEHYQAVIKGDVPETLEAHLARAPAPERKNSESWLRRRFPSIISVFNLRPPVRQLRDEPARLRIPPPAKTQSASPHEVPGRR